MKSAFVWPSWASSAFDPIDMPLFSNWDAMCLAVGPRLQSPSLNLEMRQANTNARSQMMDDVMDSVIYKRSAE